MNPMKIFFLSCLSLVSVFALEAPKQGSFEPVFASTMEIELLSRQFTTADSALKNIIEKSGAKIVRLSDNREMSNVSITLKATRPQFDSLAKLLPSLGTVASNNLQSTDLSDEIRRRNRDLTWKKRQLQDSSLSDSARVLLEESVFNMEADLEDYQATAQFHTVTVQLSEDNPYQYSYNTESWFSFINMPGVEYKRLIVEQPKSQRTVDVYQGAALRYMFTQGKSYVHLGVLRPQGEAEGDSMVSDIFYYDWGTDFYARHLGKGKRKYLNVFSGFSLGGMLLNSTAEVKHVFTLEAHIGLELLKYQFFIFDVRGGYLFPLNTEWNRNLRGASLASAMNFVF